MAKEWYVVNTVSGHEYKVKEKLENAAQNSSELQQNIFRVIVPETKEIEYKNGEPKEKIKKMFPGYVLIEMVMSDESWYIVRNTQGVTGFIGSSGKGAKPIPLTSQEIDRLLSNMGMSRLELGNELKENDRVKVIDGPFKDMIGVVSSINMDKQLLSVMLDLFGQETSVELSLAQIEKM